MLKKGYIFQYDTVKIELRHNARPEWCEWKESRLEPNTFGHWSEVTFHKLPDELVGLIDEERVPPWQERAMRKSGCF